MLDQNLCGAFMQAIGTYISTGRDERKIASGVCQIITEKVSYEYDVSSSILDLISFQ
jgi:hypothetical protein